MYYNHKLHDINHLVPHFLHVADRYCDHNWYVQNIARDFHNFLLIISGEGIAWSNHQTIKLLPGMLIYHAPGETYGYTTSQSNLMHCFGVNFQIAQTSFSHDTWVTKNIHRLPFENISHLSHSGILCKYFKDLTTVWEEGKNHYVLKCKSIFLNILYELHNQLLIQEKGKDKENIRKIEDVLIHIRKNYNTVLTLNHLASLMDFNPKYFGSFFKKHTGYTPIEYVNKVRIEKAEEYLGIGYNITETSQLVGFNDPFYFSKVFKKIKGITPRDYAKTPVHFC